MIIVVEVTVPEAFGPIPSNAPPRTTSGSGLMERKSWMLVVVMALLGIVYIFRFSDILRTPHIQINVTYRPFAPNAQPGDVLPMVFGLDADWRLTSLIVERLETGKPPRPVWRLKSDKGSDPVRGFLYGQTIAGMVTPPGPAPERLEAGAEYRVELKAGRATGAIDFSPKSADGEIQN
jgi:hypothetical protein